MTESPFARLFAPRGIAIVGASGDETRIGGQPLKALRKAGFAGGLYPVNPRYGEIAGQRCYASVAAIDGPCDLAIVALPAKAVPQAITECGAAGIPFAVILTAGFREMGGVGITIEAELARVLAETGVRAIGPNCQGMLTTDTRVWAVFGGIADEVDLKRGPVSCAFQSGGFGYAIVNLAEAQGVGLRHCVSTGNETNIAMPELLDAFLEDAGTSMAFALLEGTPDARRLMAVGRRALEVGKPLLVWKSANTAAGAKAAQSHTANMTGSAALYRAAFRQSGLISVDDVEPIVDFAKLWQLRRLPAGRNVGVLSISGGSGIVFADRGSELGLTLPPFRRETLAALAEIVPGFGSVENPADVTASAVADASLLTRTIAIVLDDPGVDQLAVLLASLPGTAALRAAEAIAAATAASDKPVSIAWSGRRSKSEAAYRVLEDAGIAIVPTPGRLAGAMARLADFADARRRLLTRPAVPMADDVPLPPTDLPKAAGALSEAASKALLARFGVAITREVVVQPGGDVTIATAHLKPPFAVKIVSRDIPHKTEAKAVMLGVAAGAALASAIAEITANALSYKPDAAIDGVLVAEMASGVEFLIGAVNDESFGAAVALGAGGIHAEAFGDVTHRIAPFDIETARDMIGELKVSRLLDGWRGAPAADREALAAMLVAVSDLAWALGPRLAELDINPVFVRAQGEGCVAADALVVLK